MRTKISIADRRQWLSQPEGYKRIGLAAEALSRDLSAWPFSFFLFVCVSGRGLSSKQVTSAASKMTRRRHVKDVTSSLAKKWRTFMAARTVTCGSSQCRGISRHIQRVTRDDILSVSHENSPQFRHDTS